MGKRKYAPSTTRAEKADGVLADLVIRRGDHPRSPIKVEDSLFDKKSEEKDVDLRGLKSPLLASLVDFSFVLTLVFAGCCSCVCIPSKHAP